MSIMSRLVQPVGRPAWLLAGLLAVALAATLFVGLSYGLVDAAARIALSMILVALPVLPEGSAEAMKAIAIRGVSVISASLIIYVVGGHEVSTAVLILIAAALGALVPQVGSTPALGLLLLGARVDQSGLMSTPGLWEVAGTSVVAGAVVLRYAGRILRLHTIRPSLSVRTTEVGHARIKTSPDSPNANHQQWSKIQYMVRLVLALSAALCLAAGSGLGVFGGHWLVTAVLLSAQRTVTNTRLRLAQRLLGNTVAALLVALLMASAPSILVMATVAAVLFFVAFSLRTINYIWWAVTAPPVLLIVGSFPLTHDWYEGGFRVALNIVGALIVVMLFWGHD
jgi:hypothetical protein